MRSLRVLRNAVTNYLRFFVAGIIGFVLTPILVHLLGDGDYGLWVTIFSLTALLIDSAPTLAVPDPLILGRAVEGVMYVIKAGATMRKAAEYGVRVQREARDNLLGVLLNDAGEILPHYYGYHDAYGYSSEEAGGA